MPPLHTVGTYCSWCALIYILCHLGMRQSPRSSVCRSIKEGEEKLEQRVAAAYKSVAWDTVVSYHEQVILNMATYLHQLSAPFAFLQAVKLPCSIWGWHVVKHHLHVRPIFSKTTRQVHRYAIHKKQRVLHRIKQTSVCNGGSQKTIAS